MRLLIRVFFAVLLLLALAACASPEVKILEERQRAIRNCILSGGHPHAGINDTILCQ